MDNRQMEVGKKFPVGRREIGENASPALINTEWTKKKKFSS
jgi:hypothetical protein